MEELVRGVEREWGFPASPCLMLHVSRAVCAPRHSAQYNPIWEFGYTIPGAGPCDMVFTSVAGHLMALDFPDHLKKWGSCAPLELYTAPVRKFVPKVRAAQHP